MKGTFQYLNTETTNTQETAILKGEEGMFRSLC